MRRKNRAERERTEHYWKLHFLHSRTFSPITFFESCAWNWHHYIYTCILTFSTHLTVRISTNFMLCFLSLPFCMHRSPFITHLLLSLNQPFSHHSSFSPSVFHLISYYHFRLQGCAPHGQYLEQQERRPSYRYHWQWKLHCRPFLHSTYCWRGTCR